MGETNLAMAPHEATRLVALRHRHPQHRGVVLVVALLALILLASLVFYVFNTGRHVQQRAVTQHAADAAAIAGASHVARSMNAVAMNNVETARLIAAVNYLDGMPMAVDFTLKDQQAALECAQSQLGRGVGPDGYIRNGLQTAIEETQAHIDALTPVDNVLNHSGFDMTTVTFYDSPAGRGRLWAAMEAFDLYSQTVMNTLPDLAQLTAARGGQVNMDGGGDALLAPAWPQIPWERGEFDDFERPVTDGLLPEDLDDKHVRRGPYDAVFGWRRPVYSGGVSAGGPSVDDDWDSPWSGGGGAGGGWIVPPEVIAYRVYGPHAWLGDIIDSASPDSGISRLTKSRLARHSRQQANIKLGYLWSDTYSDGADTVVDPEWVTSYPRAQSIAAAGSPTIREAQWLVLEYYENKINGISTGTPTYNDWGLMYPRGAALDPTGLAKQTNYIWRDERIEGTYTDNAGNVHSTHRYRYYIFAGANIGEEVEVRNPHNFNSRSDLPAPINLIHDELDWDNTAARRERLTFLGVAQRPNKGVFWPSRFNDDGYQHHVAIAQASVWNNHSWDLWTQMWHAQLEPVDDYDAWLAAADLMRGETLPGISSGDLNELADHLVALEPLAEIMLNH